LHWLVEEHRAELLGAAQPQSSRFPLLVKILDAAEKLSLQVHPPAVKASELGGEPKTEMWYIAETTLDAELFVGLKRGITRPEFERRIRDGSVADCFHRVAVRPGDAMFLPSGRVHAIGAGNVIFEIQQNSDTTYRVFDWNRLGLDGKPRELHIASSLESIDFDDFEPSLVQNLPVPTAYGTVRTLVDDPLFKVDHIALRVGQSMALDQRRCVILGLLQGKLAVTGGGQTVELAGGEFCLVPASVAQAMLRVAEPTSFLRVLPG
jgi:mannose-6-phosphate isomerase